ncbi:MAG: hypothetical protein ACFFBD_22200 [Candidatus Hodarchaeota archaeon]
MVEKSHNSLREIVGDQIYTIWVDMLRRLVPYGRTHRLATTIAAMLQYASIIAYEKYDDNPEEDSVAHSLFIASEEIDYYLAEGLLLSVVEKLFEDAQVESKRVNRRGNEYSIAKDAISEFVYWDSMPWES